MRRCRDLGVYTELVPYDIPIEELKRGIEGKIIGIILSGSPFSVHEPNSPKCSSGIVDLNIPILGICYGAQLIAYINGEVVGEGRKSEFGRTELLFKDSDLFEGLTEHGSEGGRINVWMSHGDVIERFGGADIIGYTMNSPVAAFRISDIYGVQFHPGVHHTEKGDKILWNFLYKICGCERNWTIESFVRGKIGEIKREVGSDGRVVCGLSSGIDSSTTALLVNKAIGDRLTCIFVDNGLLRKGEKEEVINTFRNNFKMRLVFVDAKERFLKGLRGVKDAEAKRMVIGELFINIFEEEAKKLGMPPQILNQHPFPGPGLAARVIGEVTEDKLRICREASHVVEEELKNSGWYDKVWQAFAIVGDDIATGVLGDARSLGRIVTVRAVESREAMTADFVKLPYEVLESMSKRIINEVKGVTWVTYAISSKPPSTIEPC